ncbi:hypothetical protein HZS_1202, partial [Henneguya salminicola]
MAKSQLNVLITGSAGRIGYSLIPMIGQGQAFGPTQSVNLVLFDLPDRNKVLQGIRMEIEDCNYSLIKSIYVTTNPEEAFTGADVVVFLGSFPRKKGMQRVELQEANKKIFKTQGEYLDRFSKKTVKAVVVGNPANSNALILVESIKKIPKENITCLMRLDHNRTISQMAKNLFVPPEDIYNVIVWGNHSNTQYPCVEFARIENIASFRLKQNANNWIEEMVQNVRSRGQDLIDLLDASSALSAAKATCDHLRDWFLGTEDNFVSMGVYSDGSYGIPNGLIFGMPVKCLGEFKYEIVKDLKLSPEAASNIKISIEELLVEKESAF